MLNRVCKTLNISMSFLGDISLEIPFQWLNKNKGLKKKHSKTMCLIVILFWILFLLVFCLFCFAPHSMCDLVPPPGIKPLPSTVEARSPNPWSTSWVPAYCFNHRWSVVFLMEWKGECSLSSCTFWFLLIPSIFGDTYRVWWYSKIKTETLNVFLGLGQETITPWAQGEPTHC